MAKQNQTQAITNTMLYAKKSKYKREESVEGRKETRKETRKERGIIPNSNDLCLMPLII